MKPQAVSKLESVFGAGVEHLMPKREDIPDDFKNMNGKTKWNRLFSKWFYSGLPQGTRFVPVEGIDADAAMRHIRAIMSSWEPKHEHKEAAVAYLLSIWFKDVIIPEAKEQP